MKRKLLSLICAMALLLSSVSAMAMESAKSPERRVNIGGAHLQGEAERLVPEVSFFGADEGENALEKELYNRIYSGTLDHDEKIDISDLEIPVSKYAAARKMYERVLLENPELMAYTKLGYEEDGNGEIIKNLVPNYLFADKAADDEARSVIESGIERYVNLAKDVPDTVGKILVVHDEFAKNIQYAQEEYDEFNAKMEEGTLTAEDWYIYCAYGVFKNDRAVCQGMSIVLAEVYERLGIPAVICYSPALDHIWNVVKVGDNWYHLDITYDDSTETLGGEVQDGAYHDWFLLSDETNAERGHSVNGGTDWVYYAASDKVCNDKTYESGQIYNGTYTYNGINYGGYYGKISYENGRYKIDVDAFCGYNAEDGKVYRYFGEMEPMYSNTIASPGAIASEIHMPLGSGLDAIQYFVTGNVKNANLFAAAYEGGGLLWVRGGGCSLTEGSFFRTTLPPGTQKVFLWVSQSAQPLSEARAK